MSTWASSESHSFFVDLCRPVSPTPSTVGFAKNSGKCLSTSRVSEVFSASFGFTATHEKWRMPYCAARVGSNSLICRK